ncbi:MAG: hypothetical protein AB1461_11845 [Thermodesulfobacteriota bacterium]
MIKYKYQISGKIAEEIWVCEACGKGKNEVILTGKWKLIDRRQWRHSRKAENKR